MEALINLRKTAHVLGVSKASIHRMANAGALPLFRSEGPGIHRVVVAKLETMIGRAITEADLLPKNSAKPIASACAAGNAFPPPKTLALSAPGKSRLIKSAADEPGQCTPHST